MGGLAALSQALGWGYFLAWSLSFYPQVLLNRRRRSVAGVAVEYLCYNVTGFLFYSIFNVVAFAAERAHGGPRSVQPNDIAFAVHALLMSSIVAVQAAVYPGVSLRGYNRVHLALLVALWVAAVVHVALATVGVLPFVIAGDVRRYSAVAFLGNAKAAISFLKYVPQAVLNCRRRSTVGWSIGNVLLDLLGGVLSFAQQFVDALRQDSPNVLTSDAPKLVLAVESVAFDILFIVQHYALFLEREPEPPPPTEAVPESELGAAESSLLAPERDGRSDAAA
jgi:cystinosin